MIPKIEGELKSRFAREMKRQVPAFLILQYATAGAPDREIVAGGITTRWEMKHGTPEFESPGQQELMCARLAAAAHCRYVVWQDIRGVQRTLIVHPREVLHRTGWLLEAETLCRGFNMSWLVEQVVREHRC